MWLIAAARVSAPRSVKKRLIGQRVVPDLIRDGAPTKGPQSVRLTETGTAMLFGGATVRPDRP